MPGGGVDTITGTFTFDPNGSPFGATLDAVDLTVTGPVHPGTYDTPVGGNLFPPDSFDVGMTPAGAAFELDFAQALGNAPDTVTSFNFNAPTIINTTPTQGVAVPVAAPGPIAGAGLPGVLAMLVGGLAWWRRKLTLSLMP
jgi:hypothetical protein